MKEDRRDVAGSESARLAAFPYMGVLQSAGVRP